MNMLDEEGDTFHGTRESYFSLSDVEWSAVERMRSAFGEEAVLSLLSSRDTDQQHSVIAKFLQRELDASRAEVTLLNQQGHQQTEFLIHQQSQSASAATTRERRRETLQLEVSQYEGFAEDSLLKWFLEVDDTIKARHIDDDEMQVAFVKSNLSGRARTWALNLH
uniref:Retrotransposon gag domain-containing protein n=1 Tax=Hyaloperonospora arabidopsidis (strain Emoy2) TaxID=559515 RepID=M4BST2_HYAAE